MSEASVPYISSFMLKAVPPWMFPFGHWQMRLESPGYRLALVSVGQAVMALPVGIPEETPGSDGITGRGVW
jgi:hypothetical protein